MNFNFIRIVLTVGLLSLLGTTNVFALDQTLVVSFTDGKNVRIGLADNPKTTFTDSDLVIETDEMKLSYPREDVANFRYENMHAGIGGVVGDEAVIINFNNDIIRITNLRQGSVVKLITADGVIKKIEKSGDTGDVTIETSDLTSGIYIVNAGSINHKIMKR